MDRYGKGNAASQSPSDSGEARGHGQHAFFDHSPLAIMVADAAGRFVEVNPAACRTTGHDEFELLNMSLEDLLAEESLETGRQHFARVNEAGRASGEFCWIHKDGSRRWSVCDAVKLSEDRFAGYFLDVTDRKRTESILTAERDLVSRLAKARHLDEVVRLCLDAAITHSGLECGGVYLVNPVSKRLGLVHHVGLSTEFVESVALVQSESVQERVLEKGATVEVPRCQMEEVGLAAALREGLSLIVAIPLAYEQRPVACLNIASRTVSSLTADARRALEAIAAQMGTAIRRAQTEEALRENESLLRSFFDSPGIMRGIVEVVGRDILHISDNTAAAEFFGHSREAMRNRYASKLGVPESVLQMWIGHCEESERTNSPVRFEYCRETASGGKWLLATVSFLGTSPQGHSRHAYVVTDVTDLKQAEEADRRLASIVTSSDDAIISKTLDGTILSWNAGAEQMYGYSAKEIKGRAISILVPPERTNELSEILSRIARGEHLSHYETVRKRKDGVCIHVSLSISPLMDARGKVVGASTIARDFSERIRAEEMLRRANAYNRSLIEASLDPLVTIGPEGKITDVNRATEEATGCSRRELLGTDFSDYFTEPEKARAGYRQVYREGQVRDYALDLRHRNGRVTSVLYSASVYHDEAGQVVGVFAAARDVTERKRAQQEKLEMERRLLHAQKLESVGVLASGIAHDFNNILAGIRMFAEAAQEDLDSSTNTYGRLEGIKKATEVAACLTRQILTYAGIRPVLPEPLNLSHAVEFMRDILDVSVSKRAELRYGLTPDLPNAQADAAQIRQVIMNLVVNASEALGDHNGTISISTSVVCVDDDSQIYGVHRDSIPHGTYVCLEVADTGCGMDQPTLEKIFDPFYTTKFVGRGLGLATVQGIVRAHRGVLQVSSEPGRGSTFRVFLPVTDASPLAPTARKAAKATRGNGKGTVLVVDDDEMIRTGEQVLLEIEGFQVLTAGDGEQAVEVFRRHREQIVCVILDMTMPKMSGEEVFREIRRLDPEVRIVLTSGYAQDAMMERFAGEDVFGYVQKPESVDAMIAKLQGSLAGGSSPDR